MKKLFIVTLTIGFVVSLTIGPAFGGWDPGEAEQKRKQTEQTIAKFKENDPGMKKFFDNAYAFAVYPTVGAGALIVGGAHGSGLVYKKKEIIGKSNITQGSVGLQVGGQSYSEIVFFKDKAALDKLQKGKVKFSGQASAIAVTAGASADADYSEGVAVFTMGKGGLMLQASIGGQELTFEPKPK
jgi:lipid-binding SYLF domain-containing protein